jgi:hypothetical protein
MGGVGGPEEGGYLFGSGGGGEGAGRVGSVVELVVLEEGQLGLDAFYDAGVFDRAGGETFDLVGGEQAPAASAGADAGEQAATDVRVDRGRLDLQSACNLGGGQVILVTFGRHPRSQPLLC